MNFLPEGYKEPTTSNYMKFKEGDNVFRVLSPAIVGFEAWEEKDGSRHPVRTTMDKPFALGDLQDPSTLKHFWAFAVYNFNAEKIQILEITQKSIMKAIKALTNNAKWGDPKDYSIVVTKNGDGLETEYTVQPEPKEKLDEKIVKQYQDMKINLDALFTGDDPFTKTDEVVPANGDEEINLDKIPF